MSEYRSGCASRRRGRSVAARVESLEERCLLATFTVSNTDNSGPGSFRQAILDSNAATGEVNSIVFNIPGPGLHTIPIAPFATDFPEITQSVTVDGYTQPGSHPNTLDVGDDAARMIALDASPGGATNLLTINADDCTIRGLTIGAARGWDGILVRGGRHTRIEGNLITHAPGTGNQDRNRNGVTLFGGTDVTIGGTTPAARNVISGNSEDGILVDNGPLAGVVIQGNSIVSNSNWGLEIHANGLTIGGTASGAGNVIQGNGDVRFLTSPFIGPVPFITGGDISNGGGGNVFLRNTIGPPQNYFQAPRSGNNLPSRPVLTSAQTSAGGTIVKWHGGPFAHMTMAFYSTAPTGRADLIPIGTAAVVADADGVFTFDTPKVVAAGQVVVAAFIDEKGNYSDLSSAVPVRASVAALSVRLVSAPAAPVAGGLLVYAAVVRNAGPDDATRVRLSDILPAGLTLVSARTTRGQVKWNRSAVVAQLGSLPAGASAVVTIVARPVAAGKVVNLARVSADQARSHVAATSTVVVAKANTPRATVKVARRVVVGRNSAALAVAFSRDMDPDSVQDLRNYRLTPLVRLGRNRVRLGSPVPLGKAVYDPIHRTVALTPRFPQPLGGDLILTINGEAPHGVRDASGRLLVRATGSSPGGAHLGVFVA